MGTSEPGGTPSRCTIGAVAIGRNEGERLRRCLESINRQSEWVVYVDSGSTDGSVALAERTGAAVVALDMNVPFTAARARNEGYRRLRELAPDVAYVQFVDGDCELADGWLQTAARFLDEHESVAMACGRLREKFPSRSIYNLLCDIEWDRPAGDTKACGGNAMIRVRAFDSVQGFRPDLIAGEDPELCVRLRAARWHIWRLDGEMALHDAAMTRFGQWWKRSMRAGYAFAEGASLHGAPPEQHYVPEARRSLVWGIILPVSIAVSAFVNPAYLGLTIIYPLQAIRIALRSDLAGSKAWWRAAFLVLGRLPEGLGYLRFHLTRFLGKRGAPVDYK